ncbi:hypothetical protein GCM10028857_18680 [Salinarchaeum chitinilyticum]
MMSLVTALLSGAVGGLFAAFGSKWLWSYYKRPKLTFDSGVIKEGESHHEEPMAWGKYWVEVSNNGRSVASNCKPRIQLIGFRETTEERPGVAPEGGFKFYDIDIHKKYVIEIVPDWDETESPTRIDLNRDESAQFELFYIHSEASPPEGTHTTIRFGEQKETEKIEDGEDIWETKPIRIETSKQGDFTHPLVDTDPRITADDFRDIEWTQKTVQITSADTEPLEGDLDFGWDEILPSVTVE